MAYTPVPTVTTNDDWTAASHNTYIKDNYATIMGGVISASGDLVYASGSSVLTRLPLTANSILVSTTDNIPAWQAFGDPLTTLRTNLPGTAFEFFKQTGEIASTTDGAYFNIPYAADTAVEFTQAEVGDYTIWESTSPTRLTIPADFPDDKWYFIHGSGYFEAGNTSTYTHRQLSLRVNGSEVCGTSVWSYYGLIVPISFSAIRKLSATNYIQMYAWHNFAPNTLKLYNPRLSVFMIT